MEQESEQQIRQECWLTAKEENLLAELGLIDRLRFLKARREMDRELARLCRRDA